MLTIFLSMLDDPEDQGKVERLFRAYRQMMFYAAKRILKDEDDAEDAVQLAFMRILNHLDDIDEEDVQKTKSYLSIIAQNIAIDMYRKKSREWKRNISYDEYEVFIEDPEGQNFEIKTDENAVRLAEAIKKLPSHYAEVIRLTYVHGYGSDKVAEILNISAENVRQRLVRARKKLAELLGGTYVK